MADEHERARRPRAVPRPSQSGRYAAEERQHQVDEPELGVGVEEQRADVHGDQAGAGEARGLVQVGDAEPVEAERRAAGAGGDAEHHRQGEHQQGDEAGAAAEVPEGVGEVHAAFSRRPAVGVHQHAVVTQEPGRQAEAADPVDGPLAADERRRW